jgi:hypothetical protein
MIDGSNAIRLMFASSVLPLAQISGS